MGDSPITRPSLLLRIRDHQDHEAWRQFVELYAPLVYQYGRRRGLQDADAGDLAQIVFQEVAGAIRKLDYDPQRGTFRGWLLVVVRNQLCKLVDRQWRGGKSVDTDDGTPLHEWPDRQSDEQLWEHEYEQRLFRWAVAQIRGDFEESTWQAFWRTAVEGQSGKQIAAELEMSVGAVYMAKSRVLDRIKTTIAEAQTWHQSPVEE